MAATTTRPYLTAPARRRQLLDAAARCFARGGYAGLTMVAVAAEAGVSRRLVYNHFPDLASLYEAYFDDRALRYVAAIDRALAAAGDDRRAGFVQAFRTLVAIPADDQRAVRLLVADPGLAELAPLRARLRAHVEARWLPAIALPALPPDLARGLLWTLVSGLLGLADLVARDELGADDALRLADALVSGLPATLAPLAHH